MVEPDGYTGPKLEIIVRQLKPEDNTQDCIGRLVDNLKKESGKVAVYLKDQSDGDLTESTLKRVESAGFVKSEMKELMDKVHMVKIQPELENMKIASAFVKWTFDNIVNEVEDIIDAEKKIKHSQIQNKVERMAEK